MAKAKKLKPKLKPKGFYAQAAIKHAPRTRNQLIEAYKGIAAKLDPCYTQENRFYSTQAEKVVAHILGDATHSRTAMKVLARAHNEPHLWMLIMHIPYTKLLKMSGSLIIDLANPKNKWDVPDVTGKIVKLSLFDMDKWQKQALISSDGKVATPNAVPTAPKRRVLSIHDAKWHFLPGGEMVLKRVTGSITWHIHLPDLPKSDLKHIKTK